ncbi:glycosyltransferase family 1 protein [Rhodophyticola sp. CCM32]|uniref:glycosyltransferase family 4 protein n=1 Tax=Rhodophyticola sp. CCM32 TaxID=2916397 RepID=UPI00107FB8D6|nr:glycosyltransferase family 1 protein [Rhodophyticola sp. CCM32]QBY02039.1 glycosyltransferase family 1 protein [Rhodophyticola sp. CCM32]
MPGAEYRICLDVTRLVSRVGRGALTGIDRVEYAYLTWCLHHHPTAIYLCRTTRGYLMLGISGATVLVDLLDGRLPLGRADMISRLYGKSGKPRHRAEAMLRPHALARSLRGRLARMLVSELPGRSVYLNVGHSNLSVRTLAAIARQPQMKLAVLVHDVIPLERPDVVVCGQPEAFGAMMARVCDQADLIIANSQDTVAALTRHATGWGRMPDTIVAHLGLPDPVAVHPPPPGVDLSHPYFVALGTIEPRKNHALLLDIWEALLQELPEDRMPHLHIIGQPGWCNAALIKRLVTHPQRGQSLFDHGALPDTQVRGLLKGAHGLLFPSLIEGFGLPPLEALREGCIPFCSDLPVMREVLGDSAVYLDPQDAYSWIETIKQRIAGDLVVPDTSKARLPDWQAHFTTVGASIDALWQDRQKGSE